MTPGVSIVIPTWNGLELLKQFLPSVIRSARVYAQSAAAPVELLVIDDGSSDQTRDWLPEAGFENAPASTFVPGSLHMRLLLNETNRGFGASCNLAFEAATHPLVFLLNNDVETSEDCIAALVENFTDDSVFAVHCRVVEFETGHECGTGKVGAFSGGFIKVHQSYVLLEPLNRTRRDELFSMFASGGSAMFDRQKLLEIGGFDELLAPAYWEDVDLSYRAWKRGFTIVYEPRSLVRHRVSSTMRKMNQRSLKRIQRRNRLIFHWINLHDKRMLRSHAAWAALLTLTAPLRLEPGFLLSMWAALSRLPAIRRRRAEEKRLSKRTDREVFAIFQRLSQRSDIRVYD